MKKSLVLFVSSLIFILLFLSGCGGGGSSSSATSSTTNIIGQATLGPLSSAEIIISDFSGNILGAYKAKTSDSDLHEAGQFDINIDSSKLPEIFLISASGGKDIDPSDNGDTNNQIDNNGTIHAIVTKDYLLSGNVIINPLTELLYDLSLDKFGDDLSAIKKDDITDFLDAEAKNYLTLANATYKDILGFNPRLDKATSKIPWGKVLSLIVSGIHKGESSFTIRNKFSIVKTLAKDEGITQSEDNKTLEQVLDDANGSRIITKIQKADDNTTVSSFEQKFITQNGEVIDIFANKINDTYSYLKATINKDGHEFKIEGKTSLLQGLSYDENTIATFVNSLISLEAQPDGSLQITIDKQLITRLSDNEVKIYIDGREPTDEEIMVINNDPVVRWVSNSTNKVFDTIVNQKFTIDGKDYNLIFNNGALILEIDTTHYNDILGIINFTPEKLVENLGKTGLVLIGVAGDDIFKNATSALTEKLGKKLGIKVAGKLIGKSIGALSLALDAKFILSGGISKSAIKLGAAHTMTFLYGKSDKIYEYQEISPVIYISPVSTSNDTRNVILNLQEKQKGYTPQYYDPKDTFPYKSAENESKQICQIPIKIQKSYIVFPMPFIFEKKFKDYEYTLNFKKYKVRSYLDIESELSHGWGLFINNKYDLYSGKNIYTNFTHKLNNSKDAVIVNASPSIAPSRENITSYQWLNALDIEIGSGKIASLKTSNLIINGNGTSSVTLKTTSSRGKIGKKTIIISGLRAANTDILINEDFESGVLGNKMSISKKGTFNINPSIKNVSTLGGNKAFGFGRSTCVASCSTNYQSSLKINFDKTTYVGDISFKVMELYGDWGSLGAIYVDGVQQDYFRQTTNTYNADDQYSNYSYRINKNVNEIELRVWDITNQSELFIDDLKITN